MFKWKEDFSVNVQNVDNQHKELFRLGTELYSLVSSRDGIDHYDEIMKVIDSLAKYTVYHFDYEEGVMRDNNYAELEEHKKQHDAFVAKINSIKTEDVDMTQRKVGMDLIVFIANWIEKHILVTDMRYKEYLNDRGVF